MEGNFYDSDGDVSVKQTWGSLAAAAAAPESNENNSFECNICLDSATEPVVTLCGHLYCWPCIYKWLQVQSNNNDSSGEPDHHHCPVCKAHISHASLVPLYGRGGNNNDSEPKKTLLDVVIPRRPAPQSHHHQNLQPLPPPAFHHHHHHHQHYFGGPHRVAALPPPVVMTSLISPTIGVVGEMVFARMFGGSGANLFPYPQPPASASPRIRRQEVQVDKSLNRVSIFLFCCIILCLLLF